MKLEIKMDRGLMFDSFERWINRRSEEMQDVINDSDIGGEDCEYEKGFLAALEGAWFAYRKMKREGKV